MMKPLHLAVLRMLPVLCLACAHSPQAPHEGPVAAPALTYETYTVGAGEPEAMLVALHYSGSTPGFWRPLLEDWRTPTRVVLPRGPHPRREGFTWFAAGHEQKATAEKTAEVEQMAARLAELIRELRAAHPRIRRVAVTGFSYGGDLAWVLALRHPELVDIAVPMGSRLLGAPTPGAPAARRVWVLQGEADPIITAPQTAARVDALKAAGVPIDVKVYPGLGHDFSPQLIEDWRTFLQQQLRTEAPR
ncbi:alpha/beta hydrolase [Myxococcus sp. Y35]|uniref:alpha/beta hydrolase n=1 Tax=Pseudomyxococcus flavus TaxID=3115648 RepID=UPI003CF84261